MTDIFKNRDMLANARRGIGSPRPDTAARHTADTWPHVLGNPAYHLNIAAKFRLYARQMRRQQADASAVLHSARLHLGLAKRARMEART